MYDQDSTQQEVYDQTAKPLVLSTLQVRPSNMSFHCMQPVVAFFSRLIRGSCRVIRGSCRVKYVGGVDGVGHVEATATSHVLPKRDGQLMNGTMTITAEQAWHDLMYCSARAAI